MKRALILLAMIISTIMLLAVVLPLDATKPKSGLVHEPSLKFVLPLLHQQGVSFSSEELKGQVTLINVWASWCVTCRIEHPLLMEVAATENLNLYGLNYMDSRSDALKWLDFYGDPFGLILVDEAGVTGFDVGVVGVPVTFVVDGNGIIRRQHIGALTRKDWDQSILPIIWQLEAEL